VAVDDPSDGGMVACAVRLGLAADADCPLSKIEIDVATAEDLIAVPVDLEQVRTLEPTAGDFTLTAKSFKQPGVVWEARDRAENQMERCRVGYQHELAGQPTILRFRLKPLFAAIEMHLRALVRHVSDPP